jgi:lipid II:glycine glycyltransferase (peptidoglycan interpeptide bridge formation enzyme)
MPQDHKGWDKQQISRQASFLQSNLWGQFQTQMGSPAHYLMENGWSCLLLERNTPLGKYLFAPYGPTLDSTAVLKDSLEQLKTYGRQMGADWLTLEPMFSRDTSSSLTIKLTELGGRRALRNREPQMTRILDLNPPENQILASISQSTRSFIRKNDREKLLDFKTSTDPNDISIFTSMLSQVSGRKKINFFSEEYFKTEAEILMPAGMMFLELALEKGQPVASALFHDFGKTSSYTFAASLPEARQTSASALLLWQAMGNAKRRGIQKMDLYGTAPEGAPPSHEWYGFSTFKKKFGGTVVEYAGTWDIPLTHKYKAYRTAYRVRSLLHRR